LSHHLAHPCRVALLTGLALLQVSARPSEPPARHPYCPACRASPPCACCACPAHPLMHDADHTCVHLPRGSNLRSGLGQPLRETCMVSLLPRLQGILTLCLQGLPCSFSRAQRQACMCLSPSGEQLAVRYRLAPQSRLFLCSCVLLHRSFQPRFRWLNSSASARSVAVSRDGERKILRPRYWPIPRSQILSSQPARSPPLRLSSHCRCCCAQETWSTLLFFLSALVLVNFLGMA
jgi:hypothetical protein